jgi:hypothetical protein
LFTPSCLFYVAGAFTAKLSNKTIHTTENIDAEFRWPGNQEMELTKKVMLKWGKIINESQWQPCWTQTWMGQTAKGNGPICCAVLDRIQVPKNCSLEKGCAAVILKRVTVQDNGIYYMDVTDEKYNTGRIIFYLKVSPGEFFFLLYSYSFINSIFTLFSKRQLLLPNQQVFHHPQRKVVASLFLFRYVNHFSVKFPSLSMTLKDHIEIIIKYN